MDELQTAIKSNRGHLAKLGPQLQAEQEQFSSNVYRHIKSLPANTLVPGGLQLQVGVILRLSVDSGGGKTTPSERLCDIAAQLAFLFILSLGLEFDLQVLTSLFRKKVLKGKT